jgi:hypothetical protein
MRIIVRIEYGDGYFCESRKEIDDLPEDVVLPHDLIHHGTRVLARVADDTVEAIRRACACPRPDVPVDGD